MIDYSVSIVPFNGGQDGREYDAVGARLKSMKATYHLRYSAMGLIKASFCLVGGSVTLTCHSGVRPGLYRQFLSRSVQMIDRASLSRPELQSDIDSQRLRDWEYT